MNVITASGIEINSKLVRNYFNNLVGLYFKILPLYEKQEKSLLTYMENLRDELEGCHHIMAATNDDPLFLSLISILQYLIDELDDTDCSVKIFRQKVFNGISVCNKLAARYGEVDEE